MGPVRGNKMRKAEEKSLVSSEEWWDVLSRKIAGNPSSSRGLDFKSRFRMSIQTFSYICSLVKDHMSAKTHFAFINGERMSLHDEVAVALTRLGSGNKLISIGESFGAHHSTVSQVTWRFVEALEENGLHHLQWPSTDNETTRIKSKFELIRGLPNCCGAIATTHVKMKLTLSTQGGETWLDSENNHSMVVQAVVDPNMRFRDIVAGFPGKITNFSVLENSNFFKQCQNGDKLNGNPIPETGLREYIVGDLGFPLLPWLVTPYRGKKLSENKKDFNERLVETHLVADKALVRLKEEWRIIQGDMWRPDKHKLPRFILVCCILQNIVIDKEDGVLEEYPSCVEHDADTRKRFVNMLTISRVQF